MQRDHLSEAAAPLHRIGKRAVLGDELAQASAQVELRIFLDVVHHLAVASPDLLECGRRQVDRETDLRLEHGTAHDEPLHLEAGEWGEEHLHTWGKERV